MIEIGLEVCVLLHNVSCKKVYESQAWFKNMPYHLAGKSKRPHSDQMGQTMEETYQRIDK